MKRRGFLGMISGAFVAPLMPSVSLGATVGAAKVAYPASAFHAAIFHAQARVNFSVFGLAQHLGVTTAQAEQMMADMSARGILGPLQGSTTSGRWALSKVWKRPFVDAATMQKVARKAKAARGDLSSPGADPSSIYAEMRPFLNHLYDICRAQGRVLHPRCEMQLR